MSHRVSITAVIAVLASLAAGAVLFVAFNTSFGGPLSVGLGGGAEPQRVSAVLPDAQGILPKSLVLVRGVKVGEVSEVHRSGDGVAVTLAVDPTRSRVYRDATLRVGHRTLFGEAYANLDPGHPASGPITQGATLRSGQVRDTVELDEALQTFDVGTRRHLRSLVRFGANVNADRRSRPGLNATFAGLANTLIELRTFSATLDDQRDDLRGLVTSSSAVVDELAARKDAIAELVSAGTDTAEALTGDADALRSATAESSRVLISARRTLSVLPPLIAAARPFVDDLIAAVPSLTNALRHLRPAASSADTVIRSLPALNRSALPVLARVETVSKVVATMLPHLEPALRDLVPALTHLGPYGRELVGLFGTGTSIRVLEPDGYTRYLSLEEDHDAKTYTRPGVDNPYGWSRFFLDSTPGLATGQAIGIGTNPYPMPGESTSHFSGTYPRLTAAPLPKP